MRQDNFCSTIHGTQQCQNENINWTNRIVNWQSMLLKTPSTVTYLVCPFVRRTNWITQNSLSNERIKAATVVRYYIYEIPIPLEMSLNTFTIKKQQLALSQHIRRKRMGKNSQKRKVICGDYFPKVKKIMKLFENMFLHNISNWKKWKAQVTTSTKKGHFSVLALGENAEPRKFSVALDYLSHPTFIKLLEEAEREFGYCHQGVIVLPCDAREIQRLLLR